MDVRSSDDTPALSLRGLGAAARRQVGWIAATAAIGVALTVFVTQRQRPVYEARATIRIADQQGTAPPTDVLTALSKPSTIETEMEILRSRSVVEQVVDTLGLRVTITDPRGAPRRTLFGVLQVDHDAQPGEREKIGNTRIAARPLLPAEITFSGNHCFLLRRAPSLPWRPSAQLVNV